MRADSEPRTTERVGSPETRQANYLNKPRTTSVAGPEPAEIHAEAPPSPNATEPISLLPTEAASQFRSRWETIQSGFVDDPRQAVEQASVLVEQALEQLTTVFEEKREQLQAGRNEIPTEDLRQTLRHYRLLLNRLF